MTKLGIYLVRSIPRFDEESGFVEARERLSLVVAESASQAADFVCYGASGNEYRASLAEEHGSVGRLGDYEPGIEGHSMVVGRGLVILEADA